MSGQLDGFSKNNKNVIFLKLIKSVVRMKTDSSYIIYINTQFFVYKCKFKSFVPFSYNIFGFLNRKPFYLNLILYSRIKTTVTYVR